MQELSGGHNHGCEAGSLRAGEVLQHFQNNGLWPTVSNLDFPRAWITRLSDSGDFTTRHKCPDCEYQVVVRGGIQELRKAVEKALEMRT